MRIMFHSSVAVVQSWKLCALQTLLDLLYDRFHHVLTYSTTYIALTSEMAKSTPFDFATWIYIFFFLSNNQVCPLNSTYTFVQWSLLFTAAQHWFPAHRCVRVRICTYHLRVWVCKTSARLSVLSTCLQAIWWWLLLLLCGGYLLTSLLVAWHKQQQQKERKNARGKSTKS